MAINHSPEIVTNGLAFYYDVANQQKSWKGGPGTNYYWNSGSPFAPWTVNGINTDITGTAQDDAPIRGAKTWKFQKTGTSNQWNGWEGTYGAIWSGSAGDIWTTSYWYKTVAPAGLTNFQVGAFYKGDWSAAYSYTVLESVDTIVADGNWRYNYTVTQLNENYTNAITVDGPAWGYSTSAGTLYINGLQWTKTAHASPPYSYNFGTRSNTQAVLDMVGKNSLTANSLTYSRNGSGFTFNGTSDYLSFPYTQANPNNFSVEAWIYHTSHSSDTNIGHQIVIPYSNYNAWIFSLNGPDSKLQLRNHNFSLSNTAYNISSPTGLALNMWYHVAATDNGQTVALYVNGSQVASIASATATSNGNMTAYIGSWGPSTPNMFFSGSIPAVRIYHRGLSAAEIRQNFNAQRGRYGI